MASQRPSFGKRQREQNRLDKVRAKQHRLAARRASGPGTKGPPIAWAEEVRAVATVDTVDDAADTTQTDDAANE